ncbi:YARHG domain-containing protein [Tepidibacter hydrothermalis]|uniref:YARHG domain-containing protein n=1 Tax=Tepidibacter hydrothermalis TaxID=3036126 RepID=A0ABY8EEY2_9FIRM|nr:YARHG domain-containing protein [Tepidibacter hydrothermalis]WFD11510.1 YARHG domain-containing protein [Tepidibacter hydrothermalis]
MKIKVNLFILFFSICIILGGCVEEDNESKNISTTDLEIESDSSKLHENITNKESEEEIDISLSLKNLNFNLNQLFDVIELNKLDSKELAILRNSIYAKHGYIFSTEEVSEYFSQFSWYKPLSKDVEKKLNNIDKENIKNIIAIEKKSSIIKNSKDNRNYSEGGTVNISLNKNTQKETLYISKEELEMQGGNFPTRIVLKVKNSEIVFDSSWNDGLYVCVTDFDNQDEDVDIYITETGTDIQATTYIYKFDGEKLYKYTQFDHFCKKFLYDQKGNIYYWFNDSEKQEFDKCFNYKTKQSSDIIDENLKIRLNKSK